MNNKEYYVSYMCIYSGSTIASSPEAAADIIAADCLYDIDGPACVTDMETGEQYEV